MGVVTSAMTVLPASGQDGSLSGLMDYKNDMAFEVSQHLWEI